MTARKFQDATGADLPVGSHHPCELVAITRHEPSEEHLKKFPDMKPSLCFRFMLFRPEDPELHGATAVRFVTDSVSKLGKLYEFVTDLRDGDPPDAFDEDDYVHQWFRITVRKKQGSDKLFVSTASPCSEPDAVPDDDWSEPDAIKKTRERAAKRAATAEKKGKTGRGRAADEQRETASVSQTGGGGDSFDVF